MNPEVLLITMPFGLIRWPSLPLGLLKSLLAREGIRCETIYANLLYAHRVGLDAFLFADGGWNKTYLNDWLFQRALFPQHALPEGDYVRDYLHGGRSLDRVSFRRACNLVGAIREQSERFLDDLVEDILKRSPAIVACSLSVVQLFACLALFKRLKERKPTIITLAGGPACEACPGIALHRMFTQIDFAFSGDADDSIVPLCRRLIDQGGTLSPQDVPRALLTPAHRADGYPSPAPRAACQNLDTLPTPDFREFYDTLEGCEALCRRILPAVVVEGSRGCWWGQTSLCGFCGDCGVHAGYRAKSGDKFLAEMTCLRRQYGVRRLVTTDNVVSPELFETLFPRLEAMGQDWSIFFEIRSNLTKEQIRDMRRSGVTYVQAGIESLHSGSLQQMNKGTRSWQNIQCLKWCRQYGISISWFFLTCFPAEKDIWNQEQAELLPLLAHLQPPRFVGIIRPDRHSPYFANADVLRMDIHPIGRYLRLFGNRGREAEDFVFHLEDRAAKGLLRDPLDRMIRPGRYRLIRAAREWLAAHQRETPPRLEMVRHEGKYVIRDTRPAATAEKHILEDPECAMLQLADEAPGIEKFLSACRGLPMGPEEAERCLRKLEERLLLIRRDDRILSLVLKAPCRELPPERELPVGWVEGEDNILAGDPLRCEAFWALETPYAAKLREDKGS